MYVFFIILTSISFLLSGSIPLDFDTYMADPHQIIVRQAHLQSISHINTLIKAHHNPQAIIDSPQHKQLSPFLLLAYLPKDLRQRILATEFLNNDYEAATEFEKRSYVPALVLLAKYEQKRHPYLHLSPRNIFILKKKQVQVVAKIEEQLLYRRQYHIPEWNTYAQLSEKEIEIYKSLPGEIVACSPNLLDKKIGFPVSWREYSTEIFQSMQNSSGPEWIAYHTNYSNICLRLGLYVLKTIPKCHDLSWHDLSDFVISILVPDTVNTITNRLLPQFFNNNGWQKTLAINATYDVILSIFNDNPKTRILRAGGMALCCIYGLVRTFISIHQSRNPFPNITCWTNNASKDHKF